MVKGDYWVGVAKKNGLTENEIQLLRELEFSSALDAPKGPLTPLSLVPAFAQAFMPWLSPATMPWAKNVGPDLAKAKELAIRFKKLGAEVEIAREYDEQAHLARVESGLAQEKGQSGNPRLPR